MSRNVVRSISRPRVTAQWHLASSKHSIQRWYSETEEVEETPSEKSIIDDKEQSTLLLRKLDQQHLSQARKNTEDVIQIVRKAQEDVATLPTTVQLLPEIPEYTLGYSRHVYQRFLPEVAEQTIKAANHLREHLIDLKYQPYEDRDESALAKEINALSEDEKRDRYKQKKNEAFAMGVRLQLKANEDIKMVAETIARHSVKKGGRRLPMPDFATTASREEGADAQTFKDLAEPVVTEGKNQRPQDWGRAVRRRSEVKAVDGSDWADAAPPIPIRKQLSNQDPREFIPTRRSSSENESKVKEKQEGAVGDQAEATEQGADDQEAEENVSLPVQESASDVQLVDDELKYSPFPPQKEIENEPSKTIAEAMGSHSAQHVHKDSAFEKSKNSIEGKVNKDESRITSHEREML